MRILAVDDDEIIRAIISEILTASGRTENTFADSAEDALDIIETAAVPFEIILLDIRMPGMNGIELCARLKAMPAYRDTPIVMVSAESDRESMGRAFAAGAMDFVSKPIENFDLIGRLHSAEMFILQQKAAQRSAYQAQIAKDTLEQRAHYSLEEPIEITDVNRVVGQMALENSLLSLSRIERSRTAVAAVGIVGFPRIFARLDTTEVYDFMADVAEAIVEGMKRANVLVAYYGHGQYVCVAEKSEMPPREDLEFLIAQEVAAMGLVYMDGSHADIDLVVGEPAQGSLFNAGRPLSLIDMALEGLGIRLSQTTPRGDHDSRRERRGVVDIASIA